MKKTFKREEIDYLLTDLLPLEKGNYYTHTYFYDYLIKEKKKLKQIEDSYRYQKKFFSGRDWHSSPLGFKVKNKDKFREISFISPIGLIESLLFNKVFGDDILSIIHKKEKFGVRIPYKKSALKYQKNNKKYVTYSDKMEKQQIKYTLESSSYFYKLKPFSSIQILTQSPSFLYNKDKFSLLMKMDIQNFFPSIYTHSYSWLIANKVYDRKGLANENSIYNIIDAFLQNINGSKTNGIVVGPEISRLLAEFLLTHLDEKIINALLNENLINDVDYKIFRFVDDYFIFSNSVINEEKIYNCISKIFNDFHLKENHDKKQISSTSKPEKNWFYNIGQIMAYIENIFDCTYTGRKIRYNDIRNLVNILINDTNEKPAIVSYLLSTFVSKFERLIKQNKEKKQLNISNAELLNSIMYIYSIYPVYNNTQKLIRCYTLLIKADEKNFKELIERNVNRFLPNILDDFINDWIDLIIFIGAYDLNLTKGIVDKIISKIFLTNNPHLLAGLTIYMNKKIENKTFNKAVNDIIYNNISKIKWDDFYIDNLSWWIYIFFSFPYLSRKNKKFIKIQLEELKLQAVSNNKLHKQILISFLLDTDKHFIIWDTSTKNMYNDFYFYTRDRSVFNLDLKDQINISF